MCVVHISSLLCRLVKGWLAEFYLCMEVSKRSNGGGGSSGAMPKWRCDICETEISGRFADIIRHLNARRLKQRHELRHDEICEKEPRVGWCEGCKVFIDNNTKALHLRTQCAANGNQFYN